MALPPPLVLCADDFAASPQTSRVIAALAAKGRINAISCMTASPGWQRDAALLRDLPSAVEIGLHLTLTEDAPITAMPAFADQGRMPSADRLTLDAYLGRLPLAEIAQEIAAQFDAFAAALDRPPAFVDGHHHCHVLPGIRALAIRATRTRAPDAWVRVCGDKPGAMLRRPFAGKAIGSALHSLGMRRALRRAGLAANTGFAGHYDFSGDYAPLLAQFLRFPSSRHLVMCHPGAPGGPEDPIGRAREREAQVLQGGAFRFATGLTPIGE